MNADSAYPLCWPEGFPRTPPFRRAHGGIKVTLGFALAHLQEEVRKLGGRDLVISTNLATKRDGTPYASAREPSDPGVAVYFDRKGQRCAIACDRYHGLYRNVRALGLTIAAMRTLERHGSSEILDRAFRGFAALPAVAGKAHWTTVLGVSEDASEADIRTAFNRAALKMHPDKGGDSAEWAALSDAHMEALRARGLA